MHGDIECLLHRISLYMPVKHVQYNVYNITFIYILDMDKRRILALICTSLIIHCTIGAPLSKTEKFHPPPDGKCDSRSLLECLVSSTSILYHNCISKCESNYDTRHECQRDCYGTGYRELENCIINFSLPTYDGGIQF